MKQLAPGFRSRNALIFLLSLNLLVWQGGSPGARAQLGGAPAAQAGSTQDVSAGSVVRGRVSGQDPQGNYLGVVGGATVELTAVDGSSAGQAIANDAGFYEIQGLSPGQYIYKVTGSGFAPDDFGRGFELPEVEDGFVLDFVLTRGRPNPTQSGILSGGARMESGGQSTPMEGVRMTAKQAAGRHYETTYTAADGSYSFELSAGEWQVSAVNIGMDAQVNPGSVTVGGRSSAKVDFVFNDSSFTVLPVTKDVFAQVNVPVEAGEGAPEVSFVNVATGESKPGTVTKISDEELESRGIADFFSDDNPVHWYEALPTEALPAGSYLAEAAKDGLPAVSSPEKEVTANAETWFDLALVMPGAGEEEFEADPVVPGVRGRVTGQSELGDYLGVVSGATIEMISETGEVGGSATSDEAGFYEIPELGAGTWIYRVNSSEFAPDDAGRGFILAEGSEVQVLDFILSRTDPVSPDPGTIRGKVWRDLDGQKLPMPGATISLKPNAHSTITTVMTDGSGSFEVQVQPDQWTASALSDEFEREISPGPVEVASGGEATIDFIFGEREGPDITRVEEVYAVVSVEQGESESTPAPAVEFVSENGANPVPGTVTRLHGHDLAMIGGDSAAAAANVHWYESTPSEPLPVGHWRVKGELENYDSVNTEPKPVRVGASTYFDLNLILGGEVEPPPIPQPGYSRVIGRVSGQTSLGDYEGVLQGARVDLFSTEGALIGSTQTNANGFYEIENLDAGEYHYRVTKDPYEPDDTGGGFLLPSEHEGYVVDFILTRPVSNPGEGTLSGIVWVDDGETRIPTRNAQVAVVDQATGKSYPARTDRDGMYELFLPAGAYSATAREESLGQVKQHGTAIAIADNSQERVDFEFEKDIPMPELPGLLTGNVRVVDEEGEFPEPGAQVLAQNQETMLVGGIGLTNEDGAYAINLPVGNWRVAASIEDLGEQVREDLIAITEGGQQQADFTFEVLMPEPGEIFGHVWAEEEEGEKMPFPNVVVAVMNETGEMVETTTDEEGMYSFVLPAENWRIAASSQELEFSQLHPETIALQEQGEERVDFVVMPPIPRMSEIFLVLAVERGLSEEGPDPVIELLPAPGPGGQGDPIDLVIAPLGANPESSPMFQELGLSVDDEMRGEWQYYMATPERGGVVPGLYVARAGLDGYVSVEAAPQSAHAGLGTLFEMDIKKIRPELLVEVVCTEGNPIPGVNVTFVNRTSGQGLADAPRVATNDKGIASQILETGFGDFNLMINGEGYQPLFKDVSVGESITTVKVELLAWPEVEVTVNDKDGRPVPDVDLKFVNRTLGKGLNDAVVAKTETQGIGSALLEDGFADYNFIASHSEYQPHAQELKVEEEFVSLTIRMFKKGESRVIDLTGVVVEKPAGAQGASPATAAGDVASGKRVPNAKIAFQAAPGMTLPASLRSPLLTNNEGAFSAKEVEEGSYSVAIAAEGYESFTGSINVTFGAPPAVLALDVRDVELENWIRMILTQGWGNPSSRQFHQNGVKEDPKDCKVDYAFGLSSLRGEDQGNSVTAYTQAVGKVHEDKWWDRSCEGYIWTLMYYNQAQKASSEIRRLVSSSYRDRVATPESQDAARMFGVAMGVLNGPWNTEAMRQNYAQIDQEVTATLQEPLRSSYLEGRNSVFNEFNDLTKAGNDAKQKAMQAAIDAKNQLQAKNGARILEIQRLLGTYTTQQQALTAQWTTYEAGANNTYNQYAAELQKIRLGIQEIQQQLAQMQRQQPAKPVACEVCAVERNGYNPQCQHCQAATRRANRANQNNAGMQGRALLLGRQLQTLQGQEQQYLGLIQGVEGQFNQAQAQYNQQIAQVTGQINDLNAELRQLQGQMANVPDPAREAENAGEEFDKSKKSFITYSKYPIEQRRQELLGYVNRKAELPNLNALPLVVPGQNKISPPLPVPQ